MNVRDALIERAERNGIEVSEAVLARAEALVREDLMTGTEALRVAGSELLGWCPSCRRWKPGVWCEEHVRLTCGHEGAP